MLVGGLALSGAQAFMGYQQGQAQAANSQAAAIAGYQGAMQEYNQQVEFLNRQEAWKWNEYQRNVAYRQELIEFERNRWSDTIDAVRGDLRGKYSDLTSGLLQMREATMASLSDMWLTHNRGQATRAVNAAARGVEGNSVMAVAQDALRSMYVKEETALTNIEWNTQQAYRQAESFRAQGQSMVNQSRPGPQPHVALPSPTGFPNMPTWAPYGIQAQAGANAGYNSSINSIIGGASGALGSYGQYYQQSNPPATTYNFNLT
jgi:hypothetical protein